MVFEQGLGLDLTVDTPSLRRAIQAVVPHAGTDPEWPRMMRVRAYVAGRWLVLAATDGVTGALATVGLLTRDAGSGCFDLSPADAKEIARLFKPDKDEEHSAALRLEVTDKELTVTDVGGMFPGKSLTLNAVPVDDLFPNVASVVARVQRAGYSYRPEQGYRTALGGRHLTKFVAAATAYGEVLVLAPTGPAAALLVTCGSGFVGVLVPARLDDDRDGDTAQWAGRFALIAESHPHRPDQPAESGQSGPDRPAPADTQVRVVDLDATLADLESALAGADGQRKPPKTTKTTKTAAADAVAAAEDDPVDPVEPAPPGGPEMVDDRGDQPVGVESVPPRPDLAPPEVESLPMFTDDDDVDPDDGDEVLVEVLTEWHDDAAYDDVDDDDDDDDDAYDDDQTGSAADWEHNQMYPRVADPPPVDLESGDAPPVDMAPVDVAPVDVAAVDVAAVDVEPRWGFSEDTVRLAVSAVSFLLEDTTMSVSRLRVLLGVSQGRAAEVMRLLIRVDAVEGGDVGRKARFSHVLDPTSVAVYVDKIQTLAGAQW